MSETVTLHCEAGDHFWQRPKQRGRRPTDCPEHSEKREASGRTRDESLALAREARDAKAAEATQWERDNVYPLVKGNDGGYAGDALSVLDFIDVRLVEYQVRRANAAETDEVDKDVGLLNEVRDRILKRARAAAGTMPEAV